MKRNTLKIKILIALALFAFLVSRPAPILAESDLAVFTSDATNITQNSATLRGRTGALNFLPGCTSLTGFSVTTGQPCSGATVGASTLPLTAYFRYSTLSIPPVFCNDIYGSNVVATKDIKLTTSAGTQSFSINVTNLSPNTTYYYCAVISNKENIIYSRESIVKEFHTNCNDTTVETKEATNVKSSSAKLNASYCSTKDVKTAFEYRESGKQDSWGKVGIINHTVGSNSNVYGNINFSLSGLNSDKSYEFRAVAETNTENIQGLTENFTTNPIIDSKNEGGSKKEDGGNNDRTGVDTVDSTDTWNTNNGGGSGGGSGPNNENKTITIIGGTTVGGTTTGGATTGGTTVGGTTTGGTVIEGVTVGGTTVGGTTTGGTTTGGTTTGGITTGTNGEKIIGGITVGGTTTGGTTTGGTTTGGLIKGGVTVDGVTMGATTVGGTTIGGTTTGTILTNSGTWSTDNNGSSGTWNDGINSGTWTATNGTGGVGIVTWNGTGNGAGTWSSPTGSGTWNNGTGAGNAGVWSTNNGGGSGTWVGGPGGGSGAWTAANGTGGTGTVTWSGTGNGTGTWSSPTGSGTWNNGTGTGGAGSGTWTNVSGGGISGLGNYEIINSIPLALGQIATPPWDAIVRYHEGIETVFSRQITADQEFAKLYGYQEGNNISTFAWDLAHLFAKIFGYISANGKEIRVSLPDVAAYQLQQKGNKLTVYEYYNNKIVDIRNITTVFKNASGYEYYFQK